MEVYCILDMNDNNSDKGSNQFVSLQSDQGLFCSSIISNDSSAADRHSGSVGRASAL